jgi:hypothetical protein
MITLKDKYIVKHTAVKTNKAKQDKCIMGGIGLKKRTF